MFYILKPEDPTRIGESTSEDEKIKNKRHCNKFSQSSSLICVLTIYIYIGHWLVGCVEA